MSIEAMSAAWNLQVPCNEKVLLLALADWHRPDQPNPFPGQDTLATKTGLSKRTVIRLLRKLEARLYVLRRRRSRANGSRTSDSYELLFLSANLSPDNEGQTLVPRCHPIQKKNHKKGYQKEDSDSVIGRERRA